MGIQKIEIKERCPMQEADCDVHNCGMNCKDAEAQARLFDAAPEMFAALSDLVVAIERAAENGIDLTGHVGLGNAFAAIRKAQGRG